MVTTAKLIVKWEIREQGRKFGQLFACGVPFVSSRGPEQKPAVADQRHAQVSQPYYMSISTRPFFHFSFKEHCSSELVKVVMLKNL